jgi:hypothetical protein
MVITSFPQDFSQINTPTHPPPSGEGGWGLELFWPYALFFVKINFSQEDKPYFNKVNPHDNLLAKLKSAGMAIISPPILSSLA